VGFGRVCHIRFQLSDTRVAVLINCCSQWSQSRVDVTFLPTTADEAVFLHQIAEAFPASEAARSFWQRRVEKPEIWRSQDRMIARLAWFRSMPLKQCS